MAKTVGHQAGQATLSNGVTNLLYTAPSTGVTKIIMCEFSAKAQTQFFYPSQNLFILTKATSDNGAANIAASFKNGTTGNAYRRHASYGSGAVYFPSDGSTGGTYGTSPIFITTNSATGYTWLDDAQAAYASYGSFYHNEFYLTPSAQVSVYHDQGYNDVLLNYAFITINET